MPTREAHLLQVERNRKLADTLSLTDYHEWTVTLYFYVAVHLIESHLAVHGYHCDDHSERNRRMVGIPLLREIFKEYQMLRTLSRQARYHALPVTPDDLSKARQSLEVIEAHIRYINTGKKA